MQYGVSGTPGSNNFINTSYTRQQPARGFGMQKQSVDLRDKYSNAGRRQEMWNRMSQMGYNPAEVEQAINYAQAMKPVMQQQANQQGIQNIFGGLQSIVSNVPDIISSVKSWFS